VQNIPLSAVARTIRDVSLAYSILAGPDGLDGYAISPLGLDAGLRANPSRPLRVGVLIEHGFGLIDPEVAATVRAAAEALRACGCEVEDVRIGILADLDWIQVFWKLQVMEAKPEFRRMTTWHENEAFKYVQGVYDAPVTSIGDFVSAEQATERRKDGFAAYFSGYDALLCPVTPVPAFAHDAAEFTAARRFRRCIS
jgi:aspartyl-tRNA(Asn)/glutamyl-tRNA(Gln) amidotransferase subunit A